jgi:hypothetical protein
MMESAAIVKTLDAKVERIRSDPSCGDFILADAKDADMAGGMAAPGKSPEHHANEGRFRSLAQYRDLMRQNVKQGLIDIMLMSASSNEVLTIQERLFDHSAITPAARANDTTDIHLAMGSQYAGQPSRPFRTATIDHIMCGKAQCPPPPLPDVSPSKRIPGAGADLGLYSLTFNNDIELDLATLDRYRAFRIEAEQKGFRHFLEVFDPNALVAPVADMGRFINDMVARTLAGVTGSGRPVFLKIPYHGPAAMEQLASYDRNLIPGILGGASGTTFDAFHQLHEAKKYGARAALYGRMINNSEHQPSFIQHLRWLADGDFDDPAEATRSYHAALAKVGIQPYRPLEEDLQPTTRNSAYAAGTRKETHAVTKVNATNDATGEPDFATMTAAEKVQWNLKRWDRVLG